MRRDKRSDHKIKILTMCVIPIMAAAMMAGCAFGDGFGSKNVFSVSGEKCSQGEAKVMLLNYQANYAECYGIDMWTYDYGDAESLEDYIKDLAIEQLMRIYIMDIVADEQNIKLDDAEKDMAAQAAAEYFNGLTESESEYIGIFEGDVKDLYERYALAQKCYRSVTDHIDDEVSDDEARVMRAMQICVADKDRADIIYAKLISGADFKNTAETESTASKIDIDVDRSSFPDDVISELFSLQDGEFSEVMEEDGLYYIFYCKSAFDPDLTDEHKAQVIKQRREDAAKAVFEEVISRTPLQLNNETFDEIHVDTSLDGVSFIDIYDKYF